MIVKILGPHKNTFVFTRKFGVKEVEKDQISIVKRWQIWGFLCQSFDLCHLVTVVTIYVQKFLRSDWQKAGQLISNSAKTWNCLSAERNTKLVQKVEIINDWQVTWKTVAKKQNGGQVCWDQQHLNSKFKG